MKCFAQVAISVCVCLALGSISGTAHASTKKKPSHSKTKQKKVSLDSVELDLDDSTPDETRKPSSVTAPAIDSGAYAKEIATAEELEKAGQPAKAVEILKPIAEKIPRRGLVLLARLYGKTGNPMAQLRTLELCLSTSPKDYVVQTLIGDALSQTARIDDAVAAYNEARKMNKMYRPAYDGLLALFEKKAESYEARILVTDMVALFPDVPRYRSILCKLFTKDDYLAKAIEFCRYAIEADPKNADNFINLALNLRDQDNGKEADEVLSRAVKRFPASEPVHSAAADLKSAKKDYGSAYTLFKKATDVDGKSDRAWIGLAQSAFELQKNEEALHAYTTACDISKKNAREMRTALGKLRSRGQNDWAYRFENGLSQHCE